MQCTCDVDEYNWPIAMDPDCGVHNRPKTWREQWHTLVDLLIRNAGR